MTYDLGIDLGTTYTAAAVYRDGRVEILPLGDRAAAIPSVVFVRDGEEPLIGEAANRRSLTDPGRVAREFKRRMGDTTPIILGTSPYSPETLVAALVRWVVAAAVRQEGEQAARITICHPANWGPYKREVLANAIRMAELDRVDYITEPEAAATFYASSERLGRGDVIAVYDLGGGTFDATVLAKTDAGFEILGQPEGIEHLGGIDFDRAVFAHVNRALGGTIDDLDPADPAAMAAVVRLRQDCTEAKEALSSDTDVSIPVLLPNVQTEVRLSRGEFEAMIRPAIAETVEAMQRALRTAGVKPQDVGRILLVGGSSRIPLVGEMVSAELGRPVAVDAHPKHSIAIGAAIAAARPEAGSVAVNETAIAPPPPEATAELAGLDLEGADRPGDVPAPGLAVSPVSVESPLSLVPASTSLDPAPVAVPAQAFAEPAAASGAMNPPDAAPAPEPAPRGKPGRRSRWPWVVALALVLVAGATAGALYLTGVIGGKNGPATAAPIKPALFRIGTTDATATKVAAVLPAHPLGIAAGPGGVWVIDAQGVISIDTDTGTQRRIALPFSPTVVVDNGHLGVWIGGRVPGGTGELWHIDPTAGQVDQSIALPDVPTALWVASDAIPPVVWVLSEGSGNLLKVDATTGTLSGSTFVGNGAHDLAVTSTVVWIANPSAGSVTPVSVATGVLGQPITLPGADSVATTASVLWVVDRAGDRVFPVDLSSGSVQGAISVANGPSRIRIGEGVLWVADATQITRIDPASHSATNIPIGGPVYSMQPTHDPAPGDKPVWVLVATSR